MGPVEKSVRDDIDQLGDLVGVEASLAEAAYRLATAIDDADDARNLPGLVKELRATLKQMTDGRVDDGDDDLGDLDAPE